MRPLREGQTGRTGVVAVDKGTPADKRLVDGCQALVLLPIARQHHLGCPQPLCRAYRCLHKYGMLAQFRQNRMHGSGTGRMHGTPVAFSVGFAEVTGGWGSWPTSAGACPLATALPVLGR